MNEDVLQMSSIVRSARKALRSGKEIDESSSGTGTIPPDVSDQRVLGTLSGTWKSIG